MFVYRGRNSIYMVEMPIKHDFAGDKFSKVKTGFNFLGKNPEREAVVPKGWTALVSR